MFEDDEEANARPPSGSMSLSRRLSTHPVITGEYKIVETYREMDSHYNDAPKVLAEPIWEQQAQEPDNYYAAFLQFCSLPMGKRKIVDGMKLWTGSDKFSWDYKGVAGQWKWQERAAKRDLYLAQQAEEQWIQRDLERREQIYNLGKRLLSTGEKGLDDIDETTINNPMAVTRLISLGHELTASSIPQAKLEADQVSEVLARLPEERRKTVLEILMARITQE